MTAMTESETATPQRTLLPTIELLGTRIHAITERTCVAHVMDELQNGRGGSIVTPNLDHLRRLRGDGAFRAICESADLVVADGMPLVWASRLQRTPLPERVAGSNLIHSLTAACAAAGRSVYFLGGDPGTAEATARILAARHPGLRVAGTSCPAVGFDRDDARFAALVADLRAAKPDVVYVALGSPKQEQCIARWKALLPSAWWLGIGISFSFVCGDVQRAPRWMQKAGLEWVHRLAQEPGRLAKRYLVHGIPFAFRLLATSAWRGLRSSARVDDHHHNA